MKGVRTGLGIVFGAAFGLLFGQLLFDDWWLGPMIGVAAGLIVGAVVELVGSGDPPQRRAPSDDES